MKKIILIDDNEGFCLSMDFILNDFEAVDFSFYNSVISFLKDYQAHWKGYLIIDVLMPHIDGLSLIKELQKRNNSMGIIVISGHADTNIEKQVKKLGAHHFLLKPFDMHKFLDVVELV